MSESKEPEATAMTTILRKVGHGSMVACGSATGGVSGAGVGAAIGMVCAGPAGAGIGYMVGTLGGILSGALVSHKAASFVTRAMKE